MKNIIEISKEYAVFCHESTCHTYDGQPYITHLEMVYESAKKFIHLIPEQNRENVLAACWLHDVIEDCRETYNDVKNKTNLEVAELVYALTNEKGKTRKDRANDKYYSGIKEVPFATFIKICDRIANYTYSCKKGSRMSVLYKNEMDEFISKLYDVKYEEMFTFLKNN